MAPRRDGAGKGVNMGRIKAKRASKHLKMLDQFVKGSRFYIYSEVGGHFLGWEFDEDDSEAMEAHWTSEIMRCAVGDFVELLDNGQSVRYFEGQPFATLGREMSSEAHTKGEC